VLMTEFRPVSDGQARIQVLADRIVRTGQLSVGLAGIAIIEIVGIVLFDKSVAMLVLDSMIFPGTSFVAIVALLGYPFLLLFVLSWRRKEELDVIIYRAVKESAIASGVRPPFLVGGDQEAVEQFREFLVSSFPSVIRRLPGKDEWEVSGLSVEALLASIQMRARNDQEMVFLFASDPRDSGRSEQGR